MSHDPRTHIAAIAARSTAETGQLSTRLQRLSWPEGSTDRTEPIALQWLRRWRPGRSGVPLAPCSCAAGRCAVCN